MNRKFAWAALLASTAWPGAALAQSSSAVASEAMPATDSSEEKADSSSADIIVTADRREQRLQDTPTSVSVVSGDALLQAQVTSTQELTQLVPSLSFTSGTSEDSSSLRIRGLGTQVFSIGVEPSVSYVVDGVVLAREVQGLGDLFDIERVEILRGPQGTLFGKNASAGVINVVTKAPSDTLTVDAFALATEDEEYQARLGISAPISDNAGFRLTGFYNDREGHINNVFDGRDTSGAQSYGGRLKVEVEPSANLTLTFIGDYRQSDTSCCQFTARALTNPSLVTLIGPVVASPTNRDANVNAPPFGSGTQYGGSVQADLDLGSATITSISAYRYFDFESDQDIDGLPFANTPVGQNAALVQLDRNFGRSEADTWTQELRIASNGDNPVDYVAGLYYYNSQLSRDFDRIARVCLVGANATRPVGSDCGAFARNLPAGFAADIDSQSLSAFGEATVDIVGPLSLIAGLRINREWLGFDFSVFNTAAAATPVTVRFADNRSTRDTALLGRGGLKLEVGPDANIFAFYSRGYKAPAFDLTTSFSPAIAEQQPVDEETSDAYELSFKGSLLDRRLFVTATLFRTDYQGFQLQAFDPVIAASRLVNAGRVRNQGLELEALIRPASTLRISAGLTYSRTRIREFVNGPCFSGQAVVATAPGAGAPLQCASNGTAAAADNTQNLQGGRIPNSPDFRVTLNARWTPDVEGPVKPFAQVGVVTQSDALFALNQNPGTNQDGYSLVNASIGADFAEQFELTLFVRNLFDTNYASAIFEGPVNNAPGTFFQILPRDASRYFGATLRFSY
jgi:iron complex outermembrane receptor protein